METVLMVVLGIFTAFGALAFALVASIVWQVLYYQLLLAPALERDLGFRHGTACLPDDNVRGYVSAVAIDSVAEGAYSSGPAFVAAMSYRTSRIAPCSSRFTATGVGRLSSRPSAGGQGRSSTIGRGG